MWLFPFQCIEEEEEEGEGQGEGGEGGEGEEMLCGSPGARQVHHQVSRHCTVSRISCEPDGTFRLARARDKFLREKEVVTFTFMWYPIWHVPLRV